MDTNYEFTVVTLGESTVGKTSITRKYCTDTFEEKCKSTVNASNLSKDLYVESSRITLDIWDTAGQERHRAIASNYYRKAQGAIVVFDITNRDTFHKVREWINELNQQCGQGVCIVLIGNKCDLETNRQVNHAQAEELASNIGSKLVYTSAKSGEGIYRAFELLSEEMLSRTKLDERKREKPKTTTRRAKNIVIRDAPLSPVTEKKSGCCS